MHHHQYQHANILYTPENISCQYCTHEYVFTINLFICTLESVQKLNSLFKSQVSKYKMQKTSFHVFCINCLRIQGRLFNYCCKVRNFEFEHFNSFFHFIAVFVCVFDHLIIHKNALFDNLSGNQRPTSCYQLIHCYQSICMYS